MPLEKDSGLEQGTFQKQSLQSNEQMFESINRSMVLLVEKVSDMAETLEALEQDFIKAQETGTL